MRKVVLVLLCCFASLPLQAAVVWGVDIPGLELQFGYDFVLNSIDDSAPNPVISNSLGLSVPFVVLPSLIFRPEAAVFFETMEYVNSRPQPVESDYPNVTILALLLNANFGYEFQPLKTLTLVPEVGLAFAVRFPIFAAGTSAGDMALPITGWYLAGRFVYPNLGLGVLYQFSDRYTLFLRVQGMDPVFNLWDNWTWWDQLLVNLNLGVRFSL
ncbi:MAG: hypothetical protein WCG80_07860 [Spirochaetales bacterium]